MKWLPLANDSLLSFRRDQERDDDVEIIDLVYAQMDAQVENDTEVKDKPWDMYRLPPITYGLIHNQPTGAFLSNVLGNLWKATNNVCGAPVCCRSKQDMYFCEACREYYHLECRRETSVPKPNKHFICKMHPRPKTGKTCCEPNVSMHLQKMTT